MDPIKKSCAGLYKSAQRQTLTVSTIFTGRRERALLAGRADRTPSSFSPVCSSRSWEPLPLWLIEIEKSMNPLRSVRSVSQFSALLLLVSRYSYHVRELLVCWLLFTAVFAALAVLVLTGALACHAGKYAIHWVSATAPVAPVAGLGPDEACLKMVPDSITLK
jgi:hypothetical protein